MPYVTLKNGNRIEALDEFTGESKGFEFDTENKKVLADFGDGSEPEQIGGMEPEQVEALNQAIADIAKLKTDVARAETKADIAGEVANTKLDNSMHSHTEGKVPVANENGQLVDSYITNANIATNAGIETSKLAFTSKQIEVLNSGINSAKVVQIQTNSENISLVESTANHADEESTRIGKLIPSAATESNQLADKNFVNSSIATSTATFRGTFNSFAELEAYSGEKDDNDYAFVAETSGSATVYKRYKYNGSTWEFEYQLNNSSFTSNQWATINSGATASTVAQVETNKNNIAANSNSIATLNASASTDGSVANKIATALASAGDGNTIGSNSGGKLEAVGLLNANGGAPIKVWEGTEASWTNYQQKTYDMYGFAANGIFKDASSMLPSDAYNPILGYGKGKFYLFGEPISGRPEELEGYTSTDGVTWNSGISLPSAYGLEYISEANGILYAGLNYSTDGITWNETSGLSSGGSVSNVVYADDNCYYVMAWQSIHKSTDGVNFTSLGRYGDGHASKLLYANGVFAVVISTQAGSVTKDNYKLYYGTNPKSLASIDLGTETTSKHIRINSLVYGNGKYLCTYTIQRTGGSAVFENHILTSSDGLNWSHTVNNGARIGNLVFFDGYFLSDSSYSTDGVNWFQYDGSQLVELENYAASPTKLILCGRDTYSATYVESSSLPKDLAVFYFEGTPTVGATVYSAPGVPSSLTVKNVEADKVTLSNNVDYNKGSNVSVTLTVADAHPDWLCNIENVGVKFGNKLIADATGSLVVDQVYNAESVNAQSGKAIAGAGFASASSLARVATSGSYNDLTNKPTIPTITDYYSATSTKGMSGKAVASAISGKADSENLARVATTGRYTDLSNTPNLAMVATSGSYNDLHSRPVLATVATSGSYNDLSDKPTFPVVDQKYNSGSENAQSGIAIANAGFLKNAATGHGSLTLLGTPTSGTNSVNIGLNTSTNNSYATAIGYGAVCNSNSGIAIGSRAICNSITPSIQLGEGTINKDSTSVFQVWNNIMLDGDTGLIPDARLSSNIARASSIPVVDQSYSASSANAQSGVAVAQAIAASGSKSKSDCFVRTMTYQLSNWTDTSDSGLSATYPKQATNTIELLTIPYNASNKVSAYVSFSGADAISGKYAPVAKVDSFNMNPNQGARVTIYATEVPSTQPTISVTVFLEYGA